VITPLVSQPKRVSTGVLSRVRLKITQHLTCDNAVKTDYFRLKFYFVNGRVRAGPSFQLGTLSTRIANLLCVTLVKAMTSGFPTRWFSAAAAENQRVGKTRRRCIYSTDRHATRDRHDLPPTNQPASQLSDSTQLKAGNYPLGYLSCCLGPANVRGGGFFKMQK